MCETVLKLITVLISVRLGTLEGFSLGNTPTNSREAAGEKNPPPD